MPSTDMRDARTGAVVTFRCGGKATIERVTHGPDASEVVWKYGTAEIAYSNGGAQLTAIGWYNMLDIVHIEPPPLTIEDQLAAANAAIRERDERLARIRNLADIGGFYPGHCMASALKQALRDILTLAEKRAEAEHEPNT